MSNRVKEQVNGTMEKATPTQQEARSIAMARQGFPTLGHLGHGIEAVMCDTLLGHITPRVANTAICAANTIVRIVAERNRHGGAACKGNEDIIVAPADNDQKAAIRRRMEQRTIEYRREMEAMEQQLA